MNWVRAVFHVHTVYSDGRASFRDLLQAARTCGVDLIFLTDHDTLETRAISGWHKHCYLFPGAEVTLRDNSHILVLGARKLPPPRTETSASALRFFRRQGALCIVAHPFDVPNTFLQLGGYPFREWKYFPEYDGVEIFNLASLAKQRVKNLRSALQVYRNLETVAHCLDEPAYRRWRESLSRPLFLPFFGLDEHSVPVRRWFIRGVVFGLERAFRMAQLWLQMPREDLQDTAAEQHILETLRAGRFFLLFPLLGEPEGLLVEIEGQEGRRVVPFQKDLRLRVHGPPGASVVCLRNGRVFAILSGGAPHTFRLREPGVYWVEGHRNGKIWFLTVPIWITEDNSDANSDGPEGRSTGAG